MISAATRERTLARVLPPWWLMLITGIAWILVGLIVLRFDYTSVSAISLLFGFVAIAAGVMEIMAMFLAAGWWKVLHIVLAIVFIVAGIVAFIHPGDTFEALAAVFSFFLIFAGNSSSSRRQDSPRMLCMFGTGTSSGTSCMTRARSTPRRRSNATKRRGPSRGPQPG